MNILDLVDQPPAGRIVDRDADQVEQTIPRVQVRARPASTMALAAGRARYEDLMEAGVHIFERQDAVLHAKTAVIDRIWSTVGSSNLDWRSVVDNAEINAVVLGSAFGGQMEQMFDDDRSRSKAIDPAAWADRPLGERLREWSAQILDELL